jgi:hypothetical protein
VDWVLIVFVVFKGLVFVTGMYFAIKWHYDREKTSVGRSALLRAGTQFVAVFLLLVVALLMFTFRLASALGIDLSLP